MKGDEKDDREARAEPRRTEPAAAALPVPRLRVKEADPSSALTAAGQACHRMPSADSSPARIVNAPRQPEDLPSGWKIILGEDGYAYCVRVDKSNARALRVGSRAMDNVPRTEAAARQHLLRKPELEEVNDRIRAYAEHLHDRQPVWYRVAPIANGIEIDLCDEANTRVRITPGTVEVVAQGSETAFRRTPVSRPMVMPAKVGNLRLLAKYLNVHVSAVPLLVGWISYVLAHPKVPTNKFPILVLQGGQGSGKTSLTNSVLLPLIDPSSVGVQTFPNAAKELAIAGQNAHVVAFDNVRSFKASMADMLCIASTGGAMSVRQLYTDDEQQVLRLHVALVLNGIHLFVTQGDLAQRCLPIHLERLPEAKRRTEADLRSAFAADLPAIERGLFDLIAKIFEHLPTAKVTNPERMLDFVQWLAAMEAADGVPPGVYQAQYSHALQEGQLDALMGNVLAAAVLAFVDSTVDEWWTGTPAELYAELRDSVDVSTTRSRDWPPNPIAMSKRLRGLQASLLALGVSVEFGRGKARQITVENKGYSDA